MKWGFVPQGDGKPHYLVVNADESEPGACKDVPLMLANPHALVEGVVIASYAIRANHAFIYIRGEVPHAIRRVNAGGARGLRRRIRSEATSSAPVSTSTSRCTPARGPTSAARRPRCSTPSRGSVGSRASSPRSRRWRDCTRAPTVVNNVETIATRAVHPQQRRRLVHVVRHREVAGIQAVRRQWPRAAPGHLRGAARHHDARAARVGGGHPRGARAEVLGSRRVERPAAHRRSTSTSPTPTRTSPLPARCSAPERRWSSTRPPASPAP